MKNISAYKYTKLDKLPKQFCYSCRKGDIDTLLEKHEILAPFDELWMSRGPFIFKSDLQQHHNENIIIIASASTRFHETISEHSDYRRITRDINIYSIPVEYSTKVRKQLKEIGLLKLIRWLESHDKKPETWKQQNHSIEVNFNVSTGVILFKKDIV